MATPLYPQVQGSNLNVTATNMGSTLSNNTINTTKGQRLTRASYGSGAFFFHAKIGGAFGTDPAGVGVLQLLVVERSLDGVVGPTPSTTGPITGKAYPFTPQPTTNSNQVYSVSNVPMPVDCDLYIYNNATGYTFTFANILNSNTDALTVQVETPGS